MTTWVIDTTKGLENIFKQLIGLMEEKEVKVAVSNSVSELKFVKKGNTFKMTTNFAYDTFPNKSLPSDMLKGGMHIGLWFSKDVITEGKP